MNNSKRPFGASDSSLNRNVLKKMEEVASKLFAPPGAAEESPSNGVASPENQLPIVHQAELQEVLPKYTSILSRASTDGVIMTDLDQLQHDLEHLLSSCVLRQRALRSDVDCFDRVDDKKDRRGKSHEKPSVKKRKVDEKPRHKNARNIRNNRKLQSTLSSVDHSSSQMNVEVENLPPIKNNDTSDRFWLSVDAYCQDVNKDNLVFLDDLIKECSQEIDMKIPALGEHYATEWSEHGIQDEQSNGCILVDSLLEEKAMADLLFTTVLDKFKSADYIKGVQGIRNGLCLETRLRNEGINIHMDDFSKSISREDEILQEIKKCQKELETVNLHNIVELKKLREVVVKDLKKQEVKAALEKVDREILNLAQKVTAAKEKGQDINIFKQETNALIQQQVQLNAELQNFNTAQLLDTEMDTAGPVENHNR